MASAIDGLLLRRTADLPVQAPTNYELVINLKTAKAIDPLALVCGGFGPGASLRPGPTE